MLLTYYRLPIKNTIYYLLNIKISIRDDIYLNSI